MRQYTIPGRLVAAGLALAVAGGCASKSRVADGSGRSVDPKYGVSASQRVIADGRPIPKGGGSYRVGQPYTIGGKRYVPREDPNYDETGIASWYGEDFHGRRTANGEIYDMNAISAAHTVLPMPSYVRVTNLENGRSLVVRVNDRGPFHDDREIDMSARAADLLGFKSKGLARVRVEYLGRADLAGSDDRQLAATLREGRSASFGRSWRWRLFANRDDGLTTGSLGDPAEFDPRDAYITRSESTVSP
jgi:rare lipoprotein A